MAIDLIPSQSNCSVTRTCTLPPGLIGPDGAAVDGEVGGLPIAAGASNGGVRMLRTSPMRGVQQGMLKVLRVVGVWIRGPAGHAPRRPNHTRAPDLQMLF